MTERRTFDIEQYLRDVRERPCFVCGLVSGDPTFAHHVVFEDEFAIAFLNKHPTLSGYVLVCPKAHLEQATGDMSLPDYLRLQRLVFAVSEAQRAVLDVERVYILSLGSQEGNRHVHWHVAPLPPGVPFEQQQFAALDAERAGVLVMDEGELAALAGRIAQAISVSGAGTGGRP
ncbi:HIT family protein [Phenylobacterium sp.]|uniref:HIT family protein n=1 Tax=Phenylobacterium sp. TaxID=1871053 RepID=UPI0035AD9AF3|nr:HIT family protein [Pseudomonadota bacterium]